MKKVFIVCLLLCACLQSLAQPSVGRKVHLTVISTEKSTLPHATVSILKMDSTLVVVKLTDSSGTVYFSELAPANYIVRIRIIGYQIYLLPVLDLVNKTDVVDTVTLQHDTAVLSNVTVTAKKPFIQFTPDKTVVNVEAGITNAGTTAMDILEKSPGVTVGRDGTISMKGKAQVMVLIDGKQTQLSAADLQAYLLGLSASQIDVIELIDNPGAKYDAAGNAGIINIKTKN